MEKVTDGYICLECGNTEFVKCDYCGYENMYQCTRCRNIYLLDDLDKECESDG